VTNSSEQPSVPHVESIAASAADALLAYYGLPASREELISLVYHAVWPTRYPGLPITAPDGLRHRARVRRAHRQAEGALPCLEWGWICVCGAHSAISRDASVIRAAAQAHGRERSLSIGGGQP
jgi:hypothetical protein